MRSVFVLYLVFVLTAARVLGSPAEAVAAALQDARRLPPDTAYRTHYLWQPEPITDSDYRVLKFQANQLSREPDFGTPRRINAELLSIIMDDYQWATVTWELMAGADPYFHYAVLENWPGGRYNGEFYPAGSYRTFYPGFWLDASQAAELSKLTGSAVPIVRADWWFMRTCRQLDLANNGDTGIGYYDWLGLKKRADFEALGAVDRKISIRLGKELRAALEQGRSGVAQLDRQIEWYAAYDGDYWLTLDTKSNADNRAVDNLERGAFRHEAEEGYISLPNGLWAYWAGDADGKRQNSVPDFIGPNDSPLHQGRDGRIHPGIGCIQCHTNGGLQNIDDWARRNLKVPNQLDTFDYRQLLALKRQYFSDLNERLEKGRARYREALRKCVGLEPEQLARLYSDYYYRYQQPRTMEYLALEIGCRPAHLKAALAAYFDKAGLVDPNERKRLGGLAALLSIPPDTLPVTYVEQYYADLQKIVRAYQP